MKKKNKLKDWVELNISFARSWLALKEKERKALLDEAGLITAWEYQQRKRLQKKKDK